MTSQRPTYDCVLVGGGVIGLSLACELARFGKSVCVLDRGQPGREASWAGAGIIPPGAANSRATPLERLIAEGSRLHGKWAEWLHAETGIDNGYRKCGGFYIAQEADEVDRLTREAARLARLGVDVDLLVRGGLPQLENTLATSIQGAYFLPAESQIRNPRHLQALLAASIKYGVTVLGDTPAEAVHIRGDRIEAIETRNGPVVGADYCLTAGSWTSESAIARQLRLDAPIKPIRGQIVLLRAPSPPCESIINLGLRYLVPRDDGHILVGSTMEDVGFDNRTTAWGVSGLLDFALRLAPKLRDCAVERAWAGLRPATADGLPILGRIPKTKNAWIASGHFRNGLTLSTVTAEIVALLICGGQPRMDLTPFSPDRFAEPQADGPPYPRPPLATRGV